MLDSGLDLTEAADAQGMEEGIVTIVLIDVPFSPSSTGIDRLKQR